MQPIYMNLHDAGLLVKQNNVPNKWIFYIHGGAFAMSNPGSKMVFCYILVLAGQYK